MSKSRKPMSEEQKQNLRDQAKARAEAKKAEVQSDVLPAPASTPTGEPVEADKKHSGELENVQAARNEMRRAMHEHPDMIEAKQAVDALDEAVAKMGQVRGLLSAN